MLYLLLFDYYNSILTFFCCASFHSYGEIVILMVKMKIDFKVAVVTLFSLGTAAAASHIPGQVQTIVDFSEFCTKYPRQYLENMLQGINALSHSLQECRIKFELLSAKSTHWEICDGVNECAFHAQLIFVFHADHRGS